MVWELASASSLLLAGFGLGLSYSGLAERRRDRRERRSEEALAQERRLEQAMEARLQELFDGMAKRMDRAAGR